MNTQKIEETINNLQNSQCLNTIEIADAIAKLIEKNPEHEDFIKAQWY